MFAPDIEAWISFFFKVLNLAALLALFVYIFKQYILDGLRAKIAQDKQAEDGMQTKALVLEQKGKELVHAAFTQEQYCRYLLEKADQWRHSSELEQEKRRHESQVLRASTIDRAKQQAATVQNERLMKIVIPKAIDEARAQLVKTYEDEKQGKEYMQNLLVLMKKSL